MAGTGKTTFVKVINIFLIKATPQITRISE